MIFCFLLRFFLTKYAFFSKKEVSQMKLFVDFCWFVAFAVFLIPPTSGNSDCCFLYSVLLNSFLLICMCRTLLKQSNLKWTLRWHDASFLDSDYLLFFVMNRLLHGVDFSSLIYIYIYNHGFLGKFFVLMTLWWSWNLYGKLHDVGAKW